MNIEKIKNQFEKIPDGYKIVALNNSQLLVLDFIAHWTFLVGYVFFFATMCTIGYGAIKNKISVNECNAKIAALEKTVEHLNEQLNPIEIVEK